MILLNVDTLPQIFGYIMSVYISKTVDLQNLALDDGVVPQWLSKAPKPETRPVRGCPE